ncbi:glycosyl transferase, group 1 [Oscillochloris trichoides DG-6]|uniref:Glycosyl transferase, group 1 n=1 Tax=Oscillochloris trichoides DG-6 TaxID=765420 RepID=E1IGL7_9CHLR|nr:glycosyltransferase [Oscillochloris trichoides]EFO79686.1 glycosyl transferase, group 1 [Oscillochloris trichoides DG-6]
MRIALLTGEYPPQPGGIGDYTQHLSSALADQGLDVAALTLREGRLVACRPDGGVDLLSAPGLSWSAWAWPKLHAAIRGWQPDWLHIQYQTGAYRMRAGINLLPHSLRMVGGAPKIAVTFHDLLLPYLFPKAGRVRVWVNQILARDADLVIATNAADAATLRGWGVPRLATIPIGSNIAVAPPPGYDRRAWRAGLGISDDAFVVAYFGLLSPSKGVDLLVEALAAAPPAQAWRLLIIGGAATAPPDVAFAAQLEHRIVQLGVAGQIIRTGHVESSAVSGHLLAADCVALPFHDGASLRRGSLLAALAHGCAVITTTPSEPSAHALLTAGPGAICIPVDDRAALGAALHQVAGDTSLRRALGQAGQAAVAGLGWPEIARAHRQVYGGG